MAEGIDPDGIRPEERDEADAYRHGYEEARDLMRFDYHIGYSAAQRLAYMNGYHKGIIEKVNESSISVNHARELMGVPLEVDFQDPSLGPKTTSYIRGLNDGFRGFVYQPGEGNRDLYDRGFEAGMKKRENGGQHQEVVTNTISVTEFDPPILFDPVKVPQHYNTGKIEVANFIADQGLDYVSGNVIKYVARAGKKDPEKELEDLEKAAAYLQMRYNLAQGKPAVVRDPETREVVWTLFKN